jgi:alpha-L-fucosidase 2
MTADKLWYTQAAKQWTDALPLGNGRLGAMVFGGIESERVALNDDTLWSGFPGQNDYYANIHQDGVFDTVQSLLKSGDYEAAQHMIHENWMGRVVNCYQPLGDLYFVQRLAGKVDNYYRDLDISTGVSTVEFVCDDVHFTREYLVSAPHQVLAIHFSATDQSKLNVAFQLTSPHPYSVGQSVNRLWMMGQAPSLAIRYPLDVLKRIQGSKHAKYPEVFDENGKVRKNVELVQYEEGKGIRFAAGIWLKHVNGISRIEDEKIIIEGADEVTLFLATATNFSGFDHQPTGEFSTLQELITTKLEKAASCSWQEIRSAAIADHARYFSKVALQLNNDRNYSHLPLEERLSTFDGYDLDLITLLFQYGRYLMIAGSRPGTQPLNLQGIWNEEILPPWASNYTLNINTEMNYWPAETCNLSEMTEPLFRMIQELSIKGAQVAEKTFTLPGWTANHNSDLWRVANPVEGNPRHSFWPVGAGWLCEHLWEHYLFTHDHEYLEEVAYPLMEGAAEFFNGWLVKNEDGFWVTPVGTSPENGFLYHAEEGTWKEASMSPGPTMDIAIAREIFSNVIEAAKILDRWAFLHDEIAEKLKNLLPYQIGKHGQLMEWSKDFDEAEPSHRHTSHLYGVFPGNQITAANKALMSAVRKTLEMRGDESTGWAKGWRICLWARLLDGNHAHKMITSLLTLVDPVKGDPDYAGGGGVYRNLFDAHPPFQIDGNFGATAGIAEMLLQSQNDEIHLLPALPDAWQSGHVTGLKARGGFVVDIYWQDSELAYAVIHSDQKTRFTIRYDEKRVETLMGSGEKLRVMRKDFS